MIRELLYLIGGSQGDKDTPVKNYYAVLDIKTLNWSWKRRSSTKAPFLFHTATFYIKQLYVYCFW